MSPPPLLLVGFAPFDDTAHRRYAGQLRTLQMLLGLRAANLPVVTVGARIPDTTEPDAGLRREADCAGSPVWSVSLAELEHPSTLRGFARRHRPVAWVGAGSFPSACACRVAGALPVWADLHGDPLAEGQAKAVTYGDDGFVSAFAWRAWACLRRADALSTVSRRQRLAALGQLGLAGRLSRRTFGHELVHTLLSIPEPLPATAGEPLRGTLFPADAVAILWLGGWNTWADADTCFAGVQRAMDEEPRLVFVATGGAIPGQDERTFERFRARVATSSQRRRFLLPGWLSTPRLSRLLADCDLALVVDHPCAETELGCRTRIATALAQGLPAVATRGAEILDDAAEQGAALLVPSAAPEALAAALISLARDPEERRRRGQKAREMMAQRTPEATTAPLVAWAAQPHRAPDAPRPLSPRRLLRRRPERAWSRLVRALRREGWRTTAVKIRRHLTGR